MRCVLGFGAAVLAGSGDALAQESYGLGNPEPLEGTISTGRPSFGTGATAVPIGRVQVEFGYTFTEDGGTSSHTAPNTLLRIGLVDGAELRFSTAGHRWRERGDDGWDDLRLGTKLEISAQAGALPALAVQPSFTVPLGDASGSDDVDPKVQLAASWDLGDGWSALVNANLAASSTGEDTESVFEHSLLLGHALTERVGVFAEYFAQYPGDSAGTQNVDFGVLYLLDANVQLDAVVGLGLNDAADDLFLGAGVSFRF